MDANHFDSLARFLTVASSRRGHCLPPSAARSVLSWARGRVWPRKRSGNRARSARSGRMASASRRATGQRAPCRVLNRSDQGSHNPRRLVMDLNRANMGREEFEDGKHGEGCGDRATASRSGNRPILDLKLNDLTEGAVVRHQDGARGQGVRGDEQIKRSERFSRTVQIRAEDSVSFGGRRIPRQDIHPPYELSHGGL